MRALVVTLFPILLGAFPTYAESPDARRLIDRAADDCQSFENGEFDARAAN